MRHSIILNEKNIEYTLRINKRAKQMRLSVLAGGDVAVTVPPRASLGFIEKMLYSHAAWIITKIDYFSRLPRKEPRLSKKEEKEECEKYKESARTLAHSRLKYFNQFYNFSYKRISIRNQKTRWGSCSHKGNLNFNYKIALLPAHLSDYIVVHELCHLAALNHSPVFWQMVKKTIPDYTTRKTELRKIRLSGRWKVPEEK